MASPLIEAKLYVPRRRRDLVPRPRLLERLSRGARSKLTLIAAPAGFGKTTLLAEWLAAAPADGRSAAWLALDQGDNHPVSFWTYLIAALRRVEPEIGAGALSLLHSPQPPPIETVLASLLNDLSAILNDVILVLDDYHAIDARTIQDGMTFLLDHLPPPLHLVIASRADPPLPLARLRARGELVEIRAADLRFTPSEAADFLQQVMGLSLSEEDIAALEIRTEGWIAGLQLAALSLQSHQDAPGFIRAFAGDHRYIVDYLVEEVLRHQPEPVRKFLLQTAILDRLNGALCDAVTGQGDSNARLEALERGNFFVVPLDDRRHWYRYHHLFADVLSVHLMAEQPDQVATLHRRASEWYEQHGSVADAIRHALAGEDFERAADLLELAIPALRRSRQEASALGWLEALPEELVRRRPVLSVGYAWALLAGGQFERAEAHLRDAERWLDVAAARRDQPQAPLAAMVVVNHDEFRRLPGAVAVYRAAQAQARGDVASTVMHARRALDLVPEDDHLPRGAAAALLGLAYWASGDLEAAHRAYVDGMAGVQRAGHIADALGCAIALADIRIAQGRLLEAMRTYEKALELAMVPGGQVLRGAADMHVGMSALHCEHGDLHTATQHLLTSQKLGEHNGLPQNPYRWGVAMARIRQARGDLDGALDLLHEAERRYMSDLFPNVRPIAALKARVWVAQGRLGEALGWARAQGLSAQDDLCYLREFEHITLARVLLARHGSDGGDHTLLTAIGLLARLLAAAEEGQRAGSAIEILVLQALAHQMRGDTPAALVPLGRALRLAEPEGYVRVFLDEGRPMVVLLEAAAQRGVAPRYVRQLLAAAGRPEERASVKAARTLALQALVEPLSERELDVLRLLKTDLSGPEIARELMVTLNTMRTHTRNIYSKLGVNGRRAAVRRAEELGLA